MPTDYDRKTLFALLTRMEQDGLVQKSKLTDSTTLFITPKGVDALIHRYNHLGLTEAPWDRKWRIVIYDVPERDRYKREKIRLALGKFGFAMFQKSIYISPHDIGNEVRAYLAQEDLLATVTMLSATQDELGDAQALSDRVFGTRQRGELYRSFLRRLHFVIGQQISERREFGLRRIRSEFVNLLGNDPFLPKELLPQDWPFFAVREAISKMM